MSLRRPGPAGSRTATPARDGWSTDAQVACYNWKKKTYLNNCGKWCTSAAHLKTVSQKLKQCMDSVPSIADLVARYVKEWTLLGPKQECYLEQSRGPSVPRLSTKDANQRLATLPSWVGWSLFLEDDFKISGTGLKRAFPQRQPGFFLSQGNVANGIACAYIWESHFRTVR